MRAERVHGSASLRLFARADRWDFDRRGMARGYRSHVPANDDQKRPSSATGIGTPFLSRSKRGLAGRNEKNRNSPFRIDLYRSSRVFGQDENGTKPPEKVATLCHFFSIQHVLFVTKKALIGHWHRNPTSVTLKTRASRQK